MAWRDDLRPASFRSVAFFVESHDFSTGRRGVQHEFIQRDQPYTEDTGRKGRQYQVTGYILGADYFSDRDQLIDACEKEGPGDLIHPYYGRVRVNCFECKVRESSRDGGFVAFSMTFVEAGEQSFPNASKDLAFTLGASSSALTDASKSSFADKFNVIGKPQFIVDSATSKIKSFSDKVSSLSKGYSQTAAQITDFAFAIRKLNANVGDLIRKPQELAEQMSSAIGFLRSAGARVRESLNALRDLLNFGDDDEPISRTTATRSTQAQNLQALNDLIKQVAMAEIANTVSDVDFESIDDASEVRSSLLASMDAQMESASDDVYQAQQDLIANIIEAVPPPGESLASIVTITPIKTINSLALSYDLYDSIELEDDIIARNKISHPAFIPGGTDLEILRS